MKQKYLWLTCFNMPNSRSVWEACAVHVSDQILLGSCEEHLVLYEHWNCVAPNSKVHVCVP